MSSAQSLANALAAVAAIHAVPQTDALCGTNITPDCKYDPQTKCYCGMLRIEHTTELRRNGRYRNIEGSFKLVHSHPFETHEQFNSRCQLKAGERAVWNTKCTQCNREKKFHLIEEDCTKPCGVAELMPPGGLSMRGRREIHAYTTRQEAVKESAVESFEFPSVVPQGQSRRVETPAAAEQTVSRMSRHGRPSIFGKIGYLVMG
jgi:hypothetical protein